MKKRAGFTLIELIIFVGIFAVAMGAFMSVFTDVSGVAIRQSSTAEVQSQSQFLLQTIQYYVERSSLVEMDADSTSNTLRLRMSAASEDPTIISLSGNAVQIQIGSAGPQTITSNKVEVSDLAFTKRSNPGGKDSVAVSFSVAFATDNRAQSFAQSARTSVARVSAATFDSDIVPDTGSTYELGTSPDDWRSINGTLYFNGANVGIGTASPSQALQVNGTIKTNDDIYVSDPTAGLILNDGDSCWRVTVSGAGALVVTAATCPT